MVTVQGAPRLSTGAGAAALIPLMLQPPPDSLALKLQMVSVDSLTAGPVSPPNESFCTIPPAFAMDSTAPENPNTVLSPSCVWERIRLILQCGLECGHVGRIRVWEPTFFTLKG